MYCSNCGKETKEGTVCAWCGGRLDFDRAANKRKAQLLYYGKLTIFGAFAATLFTAIWLFFCSDGGKMNRMLRQINAGNYDKALQIYETTGIDGMESVSMNFRQKQIEALSCYAAYIKAYQEALSASNVAEALEIIAEKRKRLEEYEDYLCQEAKDNVDMLEKEQHRDELFDQLDSYFQQLFGLAEMVEQTITVFDTRKSEIYKNQEWFTIEELYRLRDDYITLVFENIKKLKNFVNEFKEIYTSAPDFLICYSLYSYSDSYFCTLLEEDSLILRMHIMNEVIKEEDEWISRLEKNTKEQFDDYEENKEYSMVNSSDNPYMFYDQDADRIIKAIKVIEGIYLSTYKTEIRGLCENYQWKENREQLKEKISFGLQVVTSCTDNIKMESKRSWSKKEEKILLDYLRNNLIPMSGIIAIPGFEETWMENERTLDAFLKKIYRNNTGIMDVFINDYDSDGKVDMLVVYGDSYDRFDTFRVGIDRYNVIDSKTEKAVEENSDVFREVIKYEGNTIMREPVKTYWIGSGFWMADGLFAKMGFNTNNQLVEYDCLEGENNFLINEPRDISEQKATDSFSPLFTRNYRYVEERTFKNYTFHNDIKDEETVYISSYDWVTNAIFSYPDEYEEATDAFFKELVKYDLGIYADKTALSKLYELSFRIEPEEEGILTYTLFYQSNHETDYLAYYRENMPSRQEVKTICYGDLVNGKIEKRTNEASDETGGYDYEYYILVFGDMVDLEVCNEESDEIELNECFFEIPIYSAEAETLEAFEGKKVSCNLFAYNSYTRTGIMARADNLQVLPQK